MTEWAGVGAIIMQRLQTFERMILVSLAYWNGHPRKLLFRARRGPSFAF